VAVTPLFTEGKHRNVLLEDRSRGLAIQTNHHLIVHGPDAMLIDPGGHKAYPDVLQQLGAQVPGGELTHLFCTHQDPDIVAALNGWLTTTAATAYISELWLRFIPHFGIDEVIADRVVGIPDEGFRLPFGDSYLVVLPAHFLHSCGNFNVYDPTARVLYSGDLGSSIGPRYVQVTRFAEHIAYLEPFHRRYMGSRRMLRAWVAMVRQLDVDVVAPQHGAFFVGRRMVADLLAWLDELECGIDLLADALQIPDL
jgi:flavorubredoxin